MKKDVVILLTACVYPNGMDKTVLQNPAIRKQQYCDALDFYLNQTSCHIVFCENTMTDFTSQYQSYIESGQLECLTFDGNHYDHSWGKGYGEAQIILYAYHHSRLLRHARYVLKITGRIIISNVQRILQSPLLRINNLFRSDWGDTDFPVSIFFLMPPDSMAYILSNRMDQIHEGDDSQYVFERVLCRGIVDNSSLFVLPFFHSSIIHGVSGTFGTDYSTLPLYLTLNRNLHYASVVNKQQGRHFISFLFEGLNRLLVSCGRFIKRIGGLSYSFDHVTR